MEQTFIKNHDHLDWNDVCQCKAVRNLSRFTPGNTGDFEPLESMLPRVDEVAKGMKTVVDRMYQDSEEGT